MSSQKEINDFLSGDSHPQSDANSNHEVLSRKSSHKSKHTVQQNSETYDYEMQDFRGHPANGNHTYTSRPTTSYIPQYAIDGTFPIQEVIPNTQMTMSSGSDPMTVNSTGLRPRGSTTVSANILRLGDINSYHGGKFSNRSEVDSAMNEPSQNINDTPRNDMDAGDDDEPMNVPMMIKPKTLYQNPQTPTVLPSTYHPINKWSSVKHSFLKEFLAEFIGTLIMILVGTAACCQVNLGARIQQNAFATALNAVNITSQEDTNTKQMIQSLQNIITSTPSGTFDQLPLAWGGAVLMGYFASGGSAVSGAHLNPAITVANYFFRGFPAKKVPLYLAGQFIGAFAGALITFILYKRVIMEAYDEWWHVEAVGANFYTNPKSYLSSTRQFTSEFITTAVFQIGIFAMTDPYTCLSSELFPLMLFILIYSLNTTMSYQTACAINPARDMGPRLAMYALGYNRYILWEKYNHYFWVPLFAPFIGSLCGALIYDICIYQGHESPVNWPLSVYKEMLWKAWFRRPGWKRRNRGRATSDLSDFSFENDDEDDANFDKDLNSIDKKDGGILKPSKSRSKTKLKGNDAKSKDDEYDGQKTVSFKSVQRGKRGVNGIPTILEEEDSIETTSIAGDSGSDSILLSSDASSNLPNFTSADEKRNL